MKGLFVTGTDTGIGKTVASVAMLRALSAAGHPVRGMKPVASGCVPADGRLVNDDARALLAASLPGTDPDLANPFRYAPPISPHIAAREAGMAVDPERLTAAFACLARDAIVVVEGVGGVLAPLSEGRFAIDLALWLRLPVVLVVGLRLGCLNHALLSAEAIRARGLRLAGWVASRIDPAMARAEENIADLAGWLDAPLLGDLPHLPDGAADAGAERFDGHQLARLAALSPTHARD